MKLGKEISIGLTIDGRDMAVQIRNAQGLLGELRKSLQTTADSTKSVSNAMSHAGGGFRSFMLMAASARFALLDFHDVFLRLPLAVVKTAGEMERMTKLLEGLSTATDKVADANRNKNFIFNMAQNAPFEVKALTDAFIKLKTGGIDPTDGSLQALTDSVAKFGGTSDQLHRASIAIQQMGGKGVVSMEELRQQLGEAVPNAIQMMAKGVGKSMADLTKAISNGEVESKSALKRMFVAMSIENTGASEAMMETWTGMIERLKTKWVLFQNSMAGGAGDDSGVFSEARKELQKLLDAFDNGSARKFGADLSEAMYELASALSGTINMVVKYYDTVKEVAIGLAYIYGGTKLYAMIKSTGDSWKWLSAEARKGAEVYVAAETTKQQALLDTAKLEAGLGAKRVADSHGAIIAKEAQVAALNAANIDLMIQEQAAQKIAESGRVKGRFASKEVIAEKAAEAEAALLTRTAHLQNAAALEREIVAMRGNIVTTQALVVEKNALAGSLARAGTAGTVAGKALSGLGTVFTALGGWMSVATVAIMAGVWAWEKYGNAAEKNAERARRAAKGMATVSDLAEHDALITASESKVRGLQNAVDNPLFVASRAASQDLLNKEKGQLETFRKQRADFVKSIDDAAYNDKVQETEFSIKNEIAENHRAFTKRKAAIENQEKQQLLDLKSGKIKGTEEGIAADSQKQKNDAKRDSLRGEISTWEKQIAKLESEAKGQTGDAKKRIEAILDDRNIKLNTLKGELLDIDLMGTDYVHAKGKKNGAGAGSGDSGPKIGGLEKHLNDTSAELKEVQAKYGRISGDISRSIEIEQEVRAKWEKLLDDQQLTKLVKNGKKTSAVSIGSIGKDGSTDIKDKKDREQYEEGIAKEIQSKKIEVANQATASSVAALAKETEDYNYILENSGEYSEFVDTKAKQLTAEYAKQKQALSGINTALLDKVQADRMSVAASQAAFSYEQRIEMESKKLEVSLTVDAQERIRNEYALTTDRIDAEYEERRAQLLASLSDDEFATVDSNERVLAIEKAYTKARENAAKRLAFDSKTPMQKLGEQWANVTDNMTQASSSWANGFMDQMTKLVTTGKADFKSLTISILADLARIQLQKAASGVMGGIFGGNTSGATGLGGGIYDAASDTVFKSSGGILDSIKGMFGFATGGIMTEFGPASLRKYANGGIANSPQLALYGEGSRPEAFVPLPDGRSIPVTVSGGAQGGAVVTVVVNNNGSNSSEDKTTSGDSRGAWEQMAQRVKAVVQEELTTQQRPGGLLYR